MDLINFDDEVVKPSSPLPPPLIPEGTAELAPDFSNPIETADHLVKNAHDPFECLELITSLEMIQLSSKEDLCLRDGSSWVSGTILNINLNNNKLSCYYRFNFDCFSNTSHNDSNLTSSTSGGNRKSVSRCHSDSSTISSKTEQRHNDFVNRSAESINVATNKNKQQQLLKLSLFNSPNSPINASNFNDPALMQRISQEARKISRQFAMSNDSSFEDLNNVSQSLIDNSTDSINDDFRDMKVDLRNMKIKREPPDTPDGRPGTPISDKIAHFQEQLKRIKQEQDHEYIDVDAYQVKLEEPSPIKIPDTPTPPKRATKCVKKEKLEIDGMLNDLKKMVSAGNNEEAKRQLGKLSEMFASHQEPKTIEVPPMVREGTFEIDKNTGRRIYTNPNRPHRTPARSNTTEDLLEKIQSFINPDTVEVHNIQNIDSLSQPIVVLVQKDMSTPLKIPRISHIGTGLKPTSVVRALENKKNTTPCRVSSTQSTTARHSFTAPRPVISQGKGLHPYEQKLSTQQKAVTVRKSLISTMDKSPKDKSSRTAKVAPSTRPVHVRRSVSMKASVQINTGQQNCAKPTSNVRPNSLMSAKKIADSVGLSKTSTTPFKPSSAIKARSSSTRIAHSDGSKALMRPKKPAFDHGSLV